MTAASPVARPAGFWRRYAAYSLDSALLAAIATTLAWPRLVVAWNDTAAAWRGLSDTLGRNLADGLLQGVAPDGVARTMLADPGVVSQAAGVQSGIVHLLLPWLAWYALLATLYHVGFERSGWQASPGKHALHLEVVDAADDRKPATWRSVVRHVAGAVSWLTCNLGHALAAWPPQKRALHDYIAGTRVLERSDQPQLPAWARLWLLAQALVAVALLAWGIQRCAAALQSQLA